ncbi:hypothetical protein APT59_10025 [Pseudomonas oryzihabitans]|uniref:DUF4376 domain-containing protein n=1 Tax=Pseudomonas oryzihabitans TaxID=47885 RepID=A0A0U4HFB3_9PSED|nr:DUF4376 domain-containing protein [Pseudomonas oryzihabitans]ALZ84522.1 hypothetical protein APT59_10025 [Pseudomonas oryzihabitans]
MADKWVQVEIADLSVIGQVLARVGQTDPEKSMYVQGMLQVQGVTLAALKRAVAAVDPATIRAEGLKADISARRYAEETRGITVSGVSVATDRESQGLITGAALAATVDPAYVCRWKTPDGFVELDAAALLGMAGAIRAHVQACFDREADLLSAVKDGTYTDDMLGAGWPA